MTSGPTHHAAALYCPYCGYEFPDTMPRSYVWVAILMAALLAWPVFRLVQSLF